MSGITLSEIAAFLDARFDVERYDGDTNGVYIPSERPVKRLGVALEPWPGLAAWIETARLDGLFLHRPWKLADYPPLQFASSSVPAPDASFVSAPGAQKFPDAPPFENLPENLSESLNIGVLAYHLPFDEHLTLGYNPRLADALRLHNPEILGEKEGRPLGMIGDIEPQSFAVLTAALSAVFGGYDEVDGPRDGGDVTRVAVMGAMTDALVRDAHEQGARAYVTGQFRTPARLSVQETGLGVAVIGHRRSELWGLRALAGLLRERWASLEVVTAE